MQDLELLRIAQSIPAAEDEILEIGPGVAIKLMVDPAAEEPEASEGEPPAAPIAPDDDSIFVTGIDPATDLERIAAENGHPVPEMPPGSLLVTPGIASRFDKEPGDTLRLALGEKVADFEIAGSGVPARNRLHRLGRAGEPSSGPRRAQRILGAGRG